MCLLDSFCTHDIDSTPPATKTSPSPAITRCAAMAIVCKPDEQKRLMVIPGTLTGQPARKAICRAILEPVAPSGNAQPIRTSSTSAGSSLARSIACLTTWPPSVAPWVMLNAPRHDLARPVRAVETMTASLMMGSQLSKLLSAVERLAFRREFGQQQRRLPERRICMRIGRQARHAAHDVVETQHIGVEHGPAAIQRKAIAGQIDHVDVGCALGDALLENACTFVDQREDAALDDLIIGDLARHRTNLLAIAADQFVDRRIGNGIALARFVTVPAEPRLLAETTQLA